MSVPFSNNLRFRDQVLEASSGRRGVVDRTPRGRQTSVVFDGTKTSRYVDVMDLRFIPPGGQPEDVPPIDGEPPPVMVVPPKPVRPGVPAAPANDAMQALEDQLARVKQAKAELEKQFSVLRQQGDRLEKAIEVLKS